LSQNQNVNQTKNILATDSESESHSNKHKLQLSPSKLVFDKLELPNWRLMGGHYIIEQINHLKSKNL
jgi:hypothetical protein